MGGVVSCGEGIKVSIVSPERCLPGKLGIVDTSGGGQAVVCAGTGVSDC